jgi:acyl-CoA thioesterase I
MALSTAFRFLLVPLLGLLMLVAPPAGAQSSTPVLLVVGDSISAGYGLSAGQSWVDLLARRVQSEGYPYQVVNASISGDTTAGGRARLPGLLRQHKPAVVVIELGGNDALRGGDLAATQANLDAMVSAAKTAGAKPLIVGMQLPPNYGSSYVRRFAAMFGDVAKAHKVPVVPYVFDGFGEDLASFQADRIHPTASAQPRILANVWPTLSAMLARR